ncbi:MFS transporter [Alkalihalobacillus sp. AL-G]|uniref:MFS transporter n=1 Tax=Alkalihalobacillus sp. AL-G TaxID=2926399 RepID=UPI00272A2C04|nr:MFS transporter [Alkalihalobacillus sp. AL-G]WLD93245.1 MFS transporter [Alkalihalobacillus sp. AL-G]
MINILKENGLFRRLASSLFISELGSWFSYMLLIVMTYSKTETLLTTMGIAGCLSIGSIVGGVMAGVIIENKNPAKVIIATNMASAFVISMLYWLPSDIWIYYIAAFFISLVSSFRTPAFSKYIVSVVKQENLMEANAAFQTTREVIKVLGPGLAATVLALLPENQQGIGFLIDAATYVIACFMFIGISITSMEPIQEENGSGVKESFWQKWVEGLKPIKSPIVISVMLMYVFIMLGIAGVDVTFTAHVNNSGYEAEYVGYVIGALSIGMVLTSFFGSTFIKKLPLSVQLGGGTLGLGLFYGGIGFSNNLSIMMVSAFLLGIFNAGFNMSASTFWQTAIPYEQLGRFFSTITSFLSAITLIGMALVGILGTLLSPQFVIVLCGFVILVAGLVSMFVIHAVNKKSPLAANSKQAS